MELRDYLRVIRTYWRGVIVVIAVCVIAAAGYTLSEHKVYAANSTGFVTTGQNTNPALASVNDQLAQSRATSYVDVATSRAVAQEVIANLGLHEDPATLVGNISVTQPLNTVLLQITAKASSPLAAQQLADAWVKALATQVSDIEDPNHTNAAGIPKVLPIDNAELPKSPVSPKPTRNILLGLLAGLLLALGYAVLRGTLDRRIHTAAAIEKRGVSVAGLVPTARALQHSPGERLQIVTEEEHVRDGSIAAAEAFRKLRTSLTYMNVDEPPRVIVVTSPNAGDGKSTVAANLAAAVAQTGQQVILIDGDLRRPSVASGFGLVEGTGVTSVLSGRISVMDAVQPTDAHGLRIMAAGPTPPNPSELLGSKAMSNLIERFSSDHLVIIDAPPLLPVTDAAVLSSKADGVLLVISSAKTMDNELDAALDALQAVGGRTLGVVLNRAGARTAGYYYSSYYGQNPGRRKGGKKHGRSKGSRPTVEQPSELV